MDMKQTPATDSYLLRWKGDELTVKLTLDAPRKGRAVLRTNLGAASVRRREIIEKYDRLVMNWVLNTLHITRMNILPADICIWHAYPVQTMLSAVR